MIDKIFIINLEHRKDRKNQILEQLNEQGITNYEFFKGIIPSENDILNWNPKFCKDTNPLHVKNYRKYITGCLGCLLSHLEIMKISLSRGYENILILEDDCVFEKKYSDMLEIMKDFNKEYNLLYLSGSHLGEKIKITDNIYRITKTLTTGSYIVDKRVMEYICDNIIGYKNPVDDFYSQIVQKKFDCYAFFPRITRQRDGYSDIQQKNTSYKL